MSNMRFNIEGVPYIFMLQNNTMYLMDLYPSQKNILKFLETDLSYFLPEEKKPFPPPVDLTKKGWESIQNTIQDITDWINNFLNDHGIKYEFSPFFIVTFIFIICGISCYFEYFCCLKCCPDVEDVKEEEKNKNKEKELNNENIGESEGGDDKKDELKKEKEISEDEKIKREKEKEKEKDKKTNIKDDKKEDIKKKEDDKKKNNKNANKKKKKE